MLKKIMLIAAVGVLAMPVLADFSGPAMPVHLSRTSGHYQGSGGEFTLTPGVTLSSKVVTGTASDVAAGSWQTFCVERNEYVNVPGDYYGDINTFSTLGGVSGQDGNEGPGGVTSDSLDARTAYLYENFRMGTLAAGYNYANPSAGDAGALQNAIWYLEGELTSISGKAVNLYNEAVEATEIGLLYNGASPDGTATWTGLGRVRILNMWGSLDRSQYKQDQLVMVPVPGAALLGLIGLAAVRWARR